MATLTKEQFDPASAWARYQPDARRPWNLALAGHLYRRAAFGATWNQLQRAVADGPQRTIDGLLRPSADVAAFNRQYDELETPANDENSSNDLRAWWLQRMIRTPHPLLEKMTLFWHGHFAVNAAKVNSARATQRHLQLLRKHALGSFREMLAGIVHDAAVFLSLDAKANRKAMPDEDLARWLMEAFTLGPGRFAERDVRETARAFSGWFVLQNELRFIERERDAETKRILGQEGRFTSDDLVRILIEQPATAQTIVRKLYRWLISETAEPDARLIAPLAESFGKNLDVLQLVETMLRSNLFFSAAAYRQRMKSPVEFSLGIVKGLEEAVSTPPLAEALARLGQNLLHPPTAKGWIGGQNWINHATLAGRHNLAAALLKSDGPFGGKLNPAAVAGKHGSSAQFFLDLFLQGDAEPSGESSTNADARRAAYAVLTLPEFQLA
ncbi:MAG: DUF1800 domain-containing protein [Verrucomicrobiia bacterium]|jgi:uncharacterized protein (DUF1800 family)